ncbi:glutamate synthase-related protein [Thermodesulfobacteriota bacterium]
MPSKYMIHTRSVPHRFEPVSKSGVIAWEEGCLKCAVCVKKKCVYGVYDKRRLDSRQMIESIDNLCMSCLRCVQNCPKELIHKAENPEFEGMGDDHWTPEIIERLWYQSETGKIPVSGAGYPGPFSGPGFDSMWTDMSEIVRPTRDGIHGREYISTAVDIGKTPSYLAFSEDHDLLSDYPQVLNIPLPIILKMPDFGDISPETILGWVLASRQLGTLFTLPADLIDSTLGDYGPWLLPVLSDDSNSLNSLPRGVRMVEIPWSKNWQKTFNALKKSNPSLLVSLRIPMSSGMEKKASSLMEKGASIIHVEGNILGRFFDDEKKELKDGIMAVHRGLLDMNGRDEISVIASGGISMAEHVAKSLICGADAVYIDFPALIALECRMCRRCTKDLSCPVDLGKAKAKWVAARTTNLIGAWHNQLLEVMGAMGIRDARRLRGETGRAMFFEDLDRSTFESLGKVKEGCELE